METLRHTYGKALTLEGIPLWTSDGTSLADGLTFAAGDWQYSHDGGSTWTNLGTLPTMTNTVLSITLTAAELQNDEVIVRGRDQGGGTDFLDKQIRIETEDHPDAMHPNGVLEVAIPSAVTDGETMTLPTGLDLEAGAFAQIRAGFTGFGGGAILATYNSGTGAATFDPGFPTAPDTSSEIEFTAGVQSTLAVDANGRVGIANVAGTTVTGPDDLKADVSSLATSAALATVDANVDTLLTRITSTLFSGITSLAEWLGLLAGKQSGDATARTEIRATGAGSGTFDESTDSLEAIRDTEPLGTAMRGTDSALLASDDGSGLTEAGGTGDHLTALVDLIWDEVITGAAHNVNNSAAKFLREASQAVAITGTAQAGAAGSITLAAGASATDDLYKDERVAIIDGTGAGQSRLIDSYNGTTKVATVAHDWLITPDNTSVYAIMGAEVDIRAVDGQTASATAGVDFDDLAAILTGTDTTIPALIAALNDLSAAEVNAEIVDALSTDTYAEPGSVPAAAASIAEKIGWLCMLARNKVTQTSSTQTVRDDGDSTDVATSTVSDDGTTFTRGEWS